MSILEISNLTHIFSSGKPGLDNINLKVEPGEFVAIAGANGSGKTTLLRHINGLLKPSEGEIFVKGISVVKNPEKARQIVGMVFQDADTQIIGETVYDDVAFGPENLKLDNETIKKRVFEALEMTGLSRFATKRPHILSGGEKRRLAIAGVLAMKSEIFIFDEPFSNLDYPGVRQVLSQIINLKASGKTILLTTHDLEKVMAHIDRLIVMEKGKIVRDGLPEASVSGIEKFGVKEPFRLKSGSKQISWLS